MAKAKNRRIPDCLIDFIRLAGPGLEIKQYPLSIIILSRIKSLRHLPFLMQVHVQWF